MFARIAGSRIAHKYISLAPIFVPIFTGVGFYSGLFCKNPLHEIDLKRIMANTIGGAGVGVLLGVAYPVTIACCVGYYVKNEYIKEKDLSRFKSQPT